MNKRTYLLTACLGLATWSLSAADLRLGIIGLDTSHVQVFTKVFNDPNDKDHVPGGKVVVAFKGGSPDVSNSWNRVEGFTKTLTEKYGVKLVNTIPELCEQVDAVFLESVDGRPHLEQVKPVFKAKKPVFIDKPIAGSLKDAVEIFRLAKESGVPVFSSSSLRFYSTVIELKKTNVGEVHGAASWGPGHLEPHHPDLYWYGIHPTEVLYTLLGPGCESVSRTTTRDLSVIVGQWKDGRTGTLFAIHEGAMPYKSMVFGSKTVAEQQPEPKGSTPYAPMLRQVMNFFQTGVAPVSPEETLEIMTFMEAADESKRQGGAPVKLKDVLKKNGG